MQLAQRLKTKTNNAKLNSPSYAQIPNLLQHLLNPIIEVSPRVLISRLRIEVLLHLSHARVGLGAEPQLDLDEGLKAGVEVGHAEVDQLRKLGEELLVELLVGLLGDFGLALGARQLGGVLVGLLDELLHLGAHSVVVKEFVVALLDALVDVGEVGAKAGYRFEDGCSIRAKSAADTDSTSSIGPSL